MDKSIYSKQWFMYIAECRDKTLYVGIARDVERRIADHNKTNRCRYTRFRKPITAVYRESHPDHRSARTREVEVKRFSRAKKLKLICN
ncbi:MAG: GIY-YIG nuclease family protein [Candidatus Omnitrophica bacterium]|nr:GIY-YIG nuclease family protein [Candidatus Omnitrophota bacterium]